MVQDLASLLWVVNLGCIDLNPWYARCDDVDRPDFLHFDLDPVPGATFEQVRDTALLVRDGAAQARDEPAGQDDGVEGHSCLRGDRARADAKGGLGVRQALRVRARGSATRTLVTAEYRIAKRPRDRVLVDYNQNAWGRTLASVYSPRPRPLATVSTPVTWEELEAGVGIDDFRLDNVPDRVRAQGDLWAPLLARKGRFRLEPLL